MSRVLVSRLQQGFCLGLVAAILCGVPACRNLARPESGDARMKCTILPHLEGKIRAGENYVYCPTFQMAWDSLVTNMLKAPLQVEGDPEIARILNRNWYDPGNVDSNSVLIDSGYLAEGIVEDIKRRFVERFGHQDDIIKMLDELPPAVTPRDLLTFAYLEAFLGFREPFHVYETPLHFHSVNGLSKVESFGVSVLCTNAPANRQRWRQIAVNDYRGEKDFILTLEAYSKPRPIPAASSTASSDARLVSVPGTVDQKREDIIIAMIPPEGTLKDTWAAVQGRLSKEKDASGEGATTETVKIPKMELDLTNSYDELVGRRVLNPELAAWGLQIVMAMQAIKFRMNEKGVDLRSFAGMALLGGIPYMPPPRRLVVDRPFLLALREHGKEPYLVLWVGNSDFLMKDSRQIAGEDLYERGRADAQRTLKRKRLVWKTAPSPWPQLSGDEKLRTTIREEKFGVTTEVVTNLHYEALDSYIEGYRECMAAAMKAKFGDNVFTDIEKMVKQRRAGGSERASMVWLQEQQNKDGSWGVSRDSQVTLTGLALLVYLSHGETGESEWYGETLRKGFQWLTDHPPGKYSSRRDALVLPATVQTVAQIEVANMQETNDVLPALQAEVTRWLAGANSANYWYLLALRSAEVRGVLTNDVNSRIAAITNRLPSELTLSLKKKDTEQFLYWCLAQLLFTTEPLSAGANEFLSQLMSSGWHKPAAQAPFSRWYLQTTVALLAGGDTWIEWNRSMRQPLVKARGADGFWDHPGPKGCAEQKAFKGQDARLYSTAMSVLMLHSYYRYLSFLHSRKVQEEPSASEAQE